MKRFILFALLVGTLSTGVNAQNILQNPSFENLPGWDTLWFLSTVAPSSPSAVATQITTDAHQGTTSLELSNTVNPKWTYYFSDSINAKLSFQAHKSYEVSGWMKSVEEAKSAEVAIFWDSSQMNQVIYTGNPNPISDPDWFMVKDTITPTAAHDDGYLRFGLRATRNSITGIGEGRVLFDDFSIVKIPDNTETGLLAFSIPEQAVPAVINPLDESVIIEVPFGTDVTSLAPNLITLPRGAVVAPDTGVVQDFTGPVIYTITAQDQVTTQYWFVYVVIQPNTATEITGFSFAEQTGAAVIDNTLFTADIEVAFGTDLTSLAPTIDLSYGATISPLSGATKDFSLPVIYTVTAEDGLTVQDWTITVTEAPASVETDITAFTIPEESGSAIIDTTNHTVDLDVPFGTVVTDLVPDITLSPGATVSPLSGVPADFTSSVIFSVTAEDASTVQDWTVTVTILPNTATDITNFSFVEETGSATINVANHTVDIEVENGTDVSALVPTITLSAGASISPLSGIAADFTNPVIYTVTAEDAITIQDWTVRVTVLSVTEILGFTLPEQYAPAVIDNVAATVSIDVPYGTDLASLTPTLLLSSGATSVPASDETVDFTSSVTYTVTSSDQVTTQDWTVTVTTLANTATDIIDLTLPEQAGPATIDAINHTVDIKVVYGTDVTALAPIFTLSFGANINPASGAPRNFSTPLAYTVYAENFLIFQDWTITVTIAPPSSETDILEFSLAEQTGPATIDATNHTVDIEVVNGTDVTTLVPILTLSTAASSSPASGIATDFTSPVIYTITAEDGTTSQDWTVTVSAILNTGTDITDFSIAEQTGAAIIDNVNHLVTVDVPYGTDVTALVPTFTLSTGATISPLSGIANNFTAPVIYTVSAGDVTDTQDWVVSVIILPNTETDITEFSLTEQSSGATIDAANHTVEIGVPYGTDVTSLVPTLALSSGAIVSPPSGTATDFTGPVIFTVTAEDGSTFQDWTVTVTIALPGIETDITAFSIPEQIAAAIIDAVNHTIDIEVPYATDVTSLVPGISVSPGATVDPASGFATDFTSPVVYTVTAEDGSTTQDWTVTVTALLNSETDILAFSFAEQTGPATINSTSLAVDIEVENGTNVAALVPTLVLSDGATSDPPSGVAVDFSNSVVYTITAENGTATANWTITVTVDPVSVHGSTLLKDLLIYPNPATEIVNLKVNQRSDIRILDITGKVVLILSDVEKTRSVSVADFSEGVYFIQLEINGISITHKLIVQ